MAQHVQLNNVDHADLRVRTERSAALGDAVMSCALFPHEFRRAQAHYPIVFSKDPSKGFFRPQALFGLEHGSNVFLGETGWEAAYVPLAMRIAPFVIGFSARESGHRQMEVHLDLDHPRVSKDGGEPVFLDHGGHSDLLKSVVSTLEDIHEAETGLTAFSATLDELDLLEPFTLDVTLEDGSSGRLAGLYTIKEENLFTLDGDALGRLQAANVLLPVYMAVASISQFSALIERRNRQVRQLA